MALTSSLKSHAGLLRALRFKIGSYILTNRVDHGKKLHCYDAYDASAARNEEYYYVTTEPGYDKECTSYCRGYLLTVNLFWHMGHQQTSVFLV